VIKTHALTVTKNPEPFTLKRSENRKLLH